MALERFAFNLKRKTGIHFCAQCSRGQNEPGALEEPLWRSTKTPGLVRQGC
jgi:hypothetical protein